MPVPKHLNYDMWLGSTPVAPYTEKRVHPQTGYDRPGWLRCEQFGAGMITGWGAHHIDSAHWGMDTEYTGPIEVWGTAEFPKKGLWDVHGPFRTEGVYANGVRMIVSGEFPNGISFEGTDGWIFVSRGNETVTGSDPVAKLNDNTALSASNPAIIKSVIGPDEIHLPESKEHHLNWLESVKSRRQPIAPVEVAHRACSACLLHHIAMKLPRKLFWDPVKERFKNDDEANAHAVEAAAVALRRLIDRDRAKGRGQRAEARQRTKGERPEPVKQRALTQRPSQFLDSSAMAPRLVINPPPRPTPRPPFTVRINVLDESSGSMATLRQNAPHLPS